MTPQNDDLNEELRLRRQQRMERRRQAEIERRKLYIRLACVAVVIVLVTVLIVVVSINGNPTPTQTDPIIGNDTTAAPPISTDPPEQQTASPETGGQTDPGQSGYMEETTVIHIAAAGDLNVTDEVVAQGMGTAGYDFSDAFLDVAPVLSDADLTLLNFEGTLAGEPYGTKRGSAPLALAKQLAAMGVDAVQTANSASIRAGILGLESTIQSFHSVGIATIGTFANRDDFRSSGGYTVLEIQGIRIALVAFTKGVDNLGLPEGSQDCVNLLYEDYTTDYKEIDTNGINKILRAVREEQPDLTIAMLHWGSEYNEDVSSSQKRIANLMLDGGVDVILGTHSHLLQTIDFDEEEGTLVAYSLGDLYGDATTPGTNYSLILDLEITRDNLTGETAVTGFDYTPIYTLRPEKSAAGGLRVVRIDHVLARYEANYLGKITDETKDAVEYALKRIGERIVQELD